MKAQLHEHHSKSIMNVRKTKITLMTAIATVLLASAAFSAKAQFVHVRAVLPVPRVIIPAPRVFFPRVIVPAPPVCVTPAPVCVAPAPYVAVGYGHPIYRERYAAPVIVHRDRYYRRW